jgi:hypothetical protein
VQAAQLPTIPGIGYGLLAADPTVGLLRQYGTFAELVRPYVFVSGAHWLTPFCILLSVHGLGFGYPGALGASAITAGAPVGVGHAAKPEPSISFKRAMAGFTSWLNSETKFP